MKLAFDHPLSLFTQTLAIDQFAPSNTYFTETLHGCYNILKQQLEIPQVTSPPSAGRCADTAVFSHPDTDTDTTQHSHCEKQIQNCVSVLTKGGRGRKRKDRKDAF